MANRSAITAVIGIRGRVDWALLMILFLPSIYLLRVVPPLWRDSDGFNQIASTCAPKGIIHWLLGYCLCGRLVVIVAGIAGNLLQGHGFPPLSISITPLGLVLARGNARREQREYYSLAMVAVGFLVVFGSCLTTFSAARFYLPIYSLFQMAMIFGCLAAIAGLTERLETLRKSS